MRPFHENRSQSPQSAGIGPTWLMGGRDSGPSSLSQDLRRALDALLATALGTLAGIFVDSGFSVRDAIINVVYAVLGPLFDIFSAYPNAQLVVASFIHRIPIVLIVGMAAGMVLRHFRYRRLLLCSTLVWPAWLVGRKLVLAQFGALPEIAAYLMQYAFLVLTIVATDAVAVKAGTDQGKPPAAA